LEAQAAEEFAEDQAKFTDPWSEYLYVMDDISTTTSTLTQVTSKMIIYYIILYYV
jgi:hypothetical protein